MKHKLLFLFLLVFIFLGVDTSQGSGLSITAKLDSVNILMGNVNTLHIEVVENEGNIGRLSFGHQTDKGKGFVSVCGDSVEISTRYTIDTTKIGSGKQQLNFTIPVQSFDSGTYTLPKFIYYSGSDSAVSKALTFNVYPLNVGADEDISPLDSVHLPDGQRWYDWMPDWIIDFWWIFICIALAIFLFYFSLRNNKKKGLPFIVTKPQPKPWQLALDALLRLKSKKLWEQGMEKEYFTELTDILRNYLFERFGINAMEMTTRQIMDKIYESDLKDKKDYVRQILNVADFVKFAKVRPLPADSIAAYENAVRFVKETIPVEKENIDKGSREGGEKQ